jgi:1-acyl-sn-glycerol-3-phosphate acyltransferase
MSEAEINQQQQNVNSGLIDIKRIIASKNPRLLKILPECLIRYLRKILHEDSLNKHLEEHKNSYGLDFIHSSLKHFGVRISVHGIEHLRTENKILIASNHPLGGLDGMGLMAVAGSLKPDLVFPVNDLLLNLPNLRDSFIPINKHGTHPKDAIRLFDEVMQSDKTILYFPAGLVSRKRKGRISDLEWKKTFVTKAKKFNRKIVPVFIDGQNSNFFYNLANLRKFFRIKANIEMLYLVDEMYKQYDKEMNIFIGKALEWDELPGEMNDDQLAEYIRALVYQLPSTFADSEVSRKVFQFNTTIPEHATFD